METTIATINNDPLELRQARFIEFRHSDGLALCQLVSRRDHNRLQCAILRRFQSGSHLSGELPVIAACLQARYFSKLELGAMDWLDAQYTIDLDSRVRLSIRAVSDFVANAPLMPVSDEEHMAWVELLVPAVQFALDLKVT